MSLAAKNSTRCYNAADNAEDQRIKIYVKSVLTPLYANGLAIAVY